MPGARSRFAVIFFTVVIDLIGFGIIIPILPYYAQRLGAGRPVEVINAGVPGYDIVESVGRMERDILPLKPDMAEAHASLGRIHCAQDRSEQAIAHFESALEVRPDDAEMIAKLSAGQRPIAILASIDGTIVARVGGAFRLVDIERMVRDAISDRASGADHLLDDAKSRVDSGDRDAAIALYRRVCTQKCLLPRKARDAQKALKKLGVDER